jgi:hypothetical protein
MSTKDREKIRLSNLRSHRSLTGVITKVYCSMRNRVKGDPNNKKTLYYKGLPILSKPDFVLWSRGSASNLIPLRETWVKSGYLKDLVPSINRIDPSKGYTIDNMEWITWKENRSKAKHPRKLTDAQINEIRHLGDTTDRPYADIARQYGVDRTNVSLIVKRKIWQKVPEYCSLEVAQLSQ